MEKRKPWQFILIVAVLLITLFNTLPTLLYYSKPLKQPVTEPLAQEVAKGVIQRINNMEEESINWLHSLCKHLNITPLSIKVKEQNRYLIVTEFKNERDATFFKKILPRAGSLIPSVPAQLSLSLHNNNPTEVTVIRKVGLHLSEENSNRYFEFASKFDEEGKISPQYQRVIDDRITTVIEAITGSTQNALELEYITAASPTDSQAEELALSTAKEIIDIHSTLGKDHPLTKRYFASFTQLEANNKKQLVQQFVSRLEKSKEALENQAKVIEQEILSSEQAEAFVDSSKEESLIFIRKQKESLEEASKIVRQNSDLFSKGITPLKKEEIASLLEETKKTIDPTSFVQNIDLTSYNSVIQSLSLDWSDGLITFQLYDDLRDLEERKDKSEEEVFLQEKAQTFLFNRISEISRSVSDKISPAANGFVINLNNLENSESFLSFNLGEVAGSQIEQIREQIKSEWFPTQKDLVRERYPIWDFETYQSLSPQDKKLGILLYAPAKDRANPPKGFRTSSVYVVARGLGTIFEKFQKDPESDEAKAFQRDFQALATPLQQSGFMLYPANRAFDSEFKNDFIFELNDYYSNILKAAKEKFTVHGSQREAILEFTNVEQRILTANKIEDQIHEELLKSKEAYDSAQVEREFAKKLAVPPPIKNVYVENFKLSAKKYFRGDDRKILRWGLDLSGGKSVRIGLKDQNNRVVTAPEELKQAVNELYTRINKMGVSERSIRVENNNIILDFPGSQGISATDLIQASAMYFHIVNQKFSLTNPSLSLAVNGFLQEVWNEAVVTNRTDALSLNEIAWEHLGSTDSQEEPRRARNEHARLLAESGLKLQDPNDSSRTTAFNDTLSIVARFKGDDFSDWHGQSHPLIITFANYALEGSSLTDVAAMYDPSQGHTLHFGVKRSYETRDRAGTPRDDFYAWTSEFSRDKVAGTPREAYSGGNGWGMAVILNDQVISAPNLQAALSDGGQITGSFTQREINQLSADLKAGSLSFKPQILSESNISPELGKTERSKGIYAALFGLFLVCAIMTSYYRFAGVVACCAVLFNLLIMWGVLQNIDAALSLPGIAAIVLTVGMAVDANVLVFERVREEFKLSGRIASAIQIGYRKAFSAIIDSNLTTILAAVILIQFDSGPIKGFAVTLIIGIASSMFTSLFMTRYFFAGWVQNPENKELSMAQIISNSNFDFLNWAKPAFIASGIVIVIGSFFLVQQKNTIFGMDFTGGYALVADFEEQADLNYRQKAIEAFNATGAPSTDIQVQQLSRENQLRMQFGIGMEEEGRPFYGMPIENKDGTFEYAYQKDPRIEWVVRTLDEAGLKIQSSQLENLDKNWSSMSGQLSDSMRNNALLALGFALVGILLYITFRFEFKFAMAAVLATAHDVTLTLGVLALLHRIGLPVQIDLQVIGAIMTIIGYSLNDTIIVFDRVREDVKLYKRMSFAEVINHALNVTLARTILTSLTTLVVLLALVILGGSAIFTFSLVMTIGVLLGTLGSLFIAAPLLLYYHNREETKELAAAT